MNSEYMDIEMLPTPCATCAHAKPARAQPTPHYLVCTWRNDDLMPLWLGKSHADLRLVRKRTLRAKAPQICDVHQAAPDANGGLGA